MKYEFSARGHRNIRATHKTTLEFTKDSELAEKGDCIIGVEADFELDKLKKFLSCSSLTITIIAGGITEIITAVPSPSFSSSHEMVIRKTDFVSRRTFAMNSEKSSRELSRHMVKELQAGKPVKVIISEAGI